MIKRAAGEAAKRGFLVLLAAAIVVVLGLVVFNREPQLGDWAWRLAIVRELAR